MVISQSIDSGKVINANKYFGKKHEPLNGKNPPHRMKPIKSSTSADYIKQIRNIRDV